jgi:hypothetical protein
LSNIIFWLKSCVIVLESLPELLSFFLSNLDFGVLSGFTVFDNDYCDVIQSDIPVPLATKIYYSQRNNRHRSTLAHLYREASTKELCSDMVSSKISQENMIPLQSSSPRGSSVEPMDEMLNRKVCPCSFLLFKADCIHRGLLQRVVMWILLLFILRKYMEETSFEILSFHASSSYRYF